MTKAQLTSLFTVSEGDIDASPTNCWYHTDPLLGHNTH